uniref:Jumonji domain-containing protein 4 n=1 Tax=Saccoglossus kowalevskii TaxID=10224 RepID=A0ABM0MJF4_SACKO|nr:PREDICTED: jmjC domain-containing protein 4-like [Saccoglossus kowalevskii]
MDAANLTHDTFLKSSDIDVNDVRKSQVSAIDVITEELHYSQFFVKYMLPNQPCLFGSQVTSCWKSVKDWVTEEGRPNFKFLQDRFGRAVVPVANCAGKHYDSQPKEDMLFTDYIKYWKDYIDSDYSTDRKCLYLKDWHFNREYPGYTAYKTPVYFLSDWLNEFWESREDQIDDYKFVYMGPKGSWTPFHADVFRSYSWSANVCGRKKWLLFPPGQEQNLKDVHGNLAYDVTSPEMHDGTKYPNYDKVSGMLEVIQEAGEVIFVPSGWYHQVINMDDTISINHNWINGCNVDICWDFIQSELKSVEDAIADCRDMDGWHKQCQLILKANSGMDYTDLFTFLHTIAKQRMKNLNTVMATNEEFEHVNFNYHDVFDLNKILNLLKHILKNKDFSEIDYGTLHVNPKDFVASLNHFLHNELTSYL